MIAAIALRVAEAWALAAGLQLVLWLVQQRTRNAGIVDVGWALSILMAPPRKREEALHRYHQPKTAPGLMVRSPRTAAAEASQSSLEPASSQ